MSAGNLNITLNLLGLIKKNDFINYIKEYY